MVKARGWPFPLEDLGGTPRQRLPVLRLLRLNRTSIRKSGTLSVANFGGQRSHRPRVSRTVLRWAPLLRTTRREVVPEVQNPQVAVRPPVAAVASENVQLVSNQGRAVVGPGGRWFALALRRIQEGHSFNRLAEAGSSFASGKSRSQLLTRNREGIEEHSVHLRLLPCLRVNVEDPEIRVPSAPVQTTINQELPLVNLRTSRHDASFISRMLFW